jgi:hypothetical protein
MTRVRQPFLGIMATPDMLVLVIGVNLIGKGIGGV